MFSSCVCGAVFFVVAIVLFWNVHGVLSARFIIDPVCEPPRGTSCIEIRKCPYFEYFLKVTSIPRPRWLIQAMREHQCGFTDDGDSPKVCCSVPHVEEDAEEFAAIVEHENLELLPENCGLIPDDARITHGTKTAPLEFPWMVLLAYKTDEVVDFRCAGTLINERYVLTAAHCVEDPTTVGGVRLGEHDISTQQDCDKRTGICSPPVQDLIIEKIVVHPKYNKTTFANDIALLRLANTANLTYENARPVCLPVGREHAKTLQAAKYAVVTGWGVTENGYKSAKLRKIHIPIVSMDECRRVYRGRSSITKRQLCAGGFQGMDSCAGDSGGPLMIPTAHAKGSIKFVQHGIVSFGPRYCGTDGQPGIYTKVGWYLRWILDNMRRWDDG